MTVPKKSEVATLDKSAPAAAAQPRPNTGLVAQFAAKFSIDPDKMLETLKQTAFKQRPPKGGGEPKVVTTEQMMALLVIAKEYGLNPFTREIYAFPSENGIVPIIGFDGWVRLINTRPELDYMTITEAPPEVDQENYYVEVEIKRRDRSRPTVVREYLKECYRNTDPWNDMPRRMTRHKAIIQAGRIAFGYSGVYDPDDADKIYNNAIDVTPRDGQGKPRTAAPQARAQAEDPPPPAPRITLDQATILADKIKEEGVDISLLLAVFEIGTLEELPANQFAAANAQIDEFSKGPK